jgi:hypothetical protein
MGRTTGAGGTMTQDRRDPERLSEIEVRRTTEILLELDDEKLEAIRACLEKGRLSIRISDVDLSQGGRLQAGYLYD